MLYLDSSALAKRYFLERGSKAMRRRLEQGDRVFTSELSYAEIHSAFAWKYHQRKISRRTFHRLREAFLNDWLFALNHVSVESSILEGIPRLLEKDYLKGSDAIHLVAGLWLRDRMMLSPSFAGGDGALEFAVADATLAAAAAKCGLRVFNPEAAG